MKQLSTDYINQELSSGTMKDEDLIPTFRDFLTSIAADCDIQEQVNILSSQINDLPYDDEGNYIIENSREDAFDVLNDLFDLLDEIAPPGCYFGSCAGDGTSYGFWLLDVLGLRGYVEEQLFICLADLDTMSFIDLHKKLETVTGVVKTAAELG